MSNPNFKAPSGEPADRASLDRELGAQDIVGFWKLRHAYEAFEPQNPEKAALWRYADYSPLGFASTRLIPIEEADRRNLMFSNPGLPGTGTITQRLFGGVQVIPPGELSPVHRHVGAATRVMLEGKGAYTTVERDKSALERGDVVTNPAGAWHETGNEGSEPVMWFDTLELPLTKWLGTNFFFNNYAEEEGGSRVAKKFQTAKPRVNWSANAYGVGGVRPDWVSHHVARGAGSPQFLYRYEPTRELLERLRDDEGSPHDGIIVEYYSPETGGSVLRTLGVHMQMLRANERTLEQRSTAARIFVCLEGSGTTVVGDTRLEWQRNDVFVVPGWAWYRIENGPKNSVLYSVTDAPTLRALGHLVEERKTRAGEIVRTHGEPR
ncbi:MAG TPA: cupin domain-containing protein [Steroidobacteraceae bacterium]|nr:cupin domain-containing protein [Steroidobacteraceae bacterium]